ncbi:MAG: hypothetical protein WAN14_24785 [Candidatus Acidiferrales bacterium]
MNLIKTMTTASTSKMWMNPPKVEEVATPRIHNASKIMKTAASISCLHSSFHMAGLKREAASPKGGCELRNYSIALNAMEYYADLGSLSVH